MRRVFTKAGIPVSKIKRTKIQKKLLSADAKENCMKYTLENLLAASKDEGIEIGKNEGKEEGIAEVLANLRRLGLSEDIIRKAAPAKYQQNQSQA